MKPTFKTKERAEGARQRCTAKERAEYLARFERSGQSVAEFCRTHGLRTPTFYGWRYQARRGDHGQAEAAVFAEVAVASAGPAAGVCIHIGTVALEVTPGADPAWIGRLVRELTSQA